MHIGMLAGEPSGDLLGAGLLRALSSHIPHLASSGIGGPAMQAAGFVSHYEMERLSVMGFIEPLRRLPELLAIRQGILRYFLENKPAVFIGIDSPDFNLGIEVKLRAAGIPVAHYVSPSVWAWRQGRIHKIAKAVDLMLTLFPFEADFYTRHHVPVKFVGHPLADDIPLVNDKQAARQKLGLDPDGVYLAVLPGSRYGEIQQLGPIFVAAVQRCQKKIPDLQCLVPMIHTARAAEFKQLSQKIAPDLPLTIFQNASRDVIAAADCVLVTSGTATLETMLVGRPMVIAFRMGRWSFQLAKRLVKVPFIGLPNLLADQCIVPEFIQDAATPDNLAQAVLDFLLSPEKSAVLQDKFLALHQALRCDASRQAAAGVLQLL